jgi:GDP-D-mannose dehydratase
MTSLQRSHTRLNWGQHVRFDERYLRAGEVDPLIGDVIEAKAVPGKTVSTLTTGLVTIMVDVDIERLAVHFGGDNAWPPRGPARRPAGNLA